MEIGELSWRTTNPNPVEANEQETREELDLVEEIRNQAAMPEALIKERMAAQFNARVLHKDFEVGDLILRGADVGQKNAAQGKLAPNWEGTYRVVSKTGKGAYKLETLDKKSIPRTWNATKLRKYFT